MNVFYFCYWTGYFCIYFYSWERIRQHVQRHIFINLWYFHLLVIGHLKRICLAIWSPETHMSSGGFNFLFFKDQEINFMKRKRRNSCHFCPSASQKCLKYYGISGLLCHLPRPACKFLLLESLFHHLATDWTFLTVLEMEYSFRLFQNGPCYPGFIFHAEVQSILSTYCVTLPPYG